MEELFEEQSQYIYLHPGLKTETDPFEHTVETTLLNPLPVKAIVTDLTFSKIQWSMPGIVTDKAKSIVIEKKYETLLKQSYKIEINREFYNGWQINGRLQFTVEGNYIRASVYIKKV